MQNPQKFMQIMELREEVEETTSKEKLQKLLDAANKEREQLLKEISSKSIQGFDQNYDAIKDLVIDLIYQNKLRESIIEKL